MSLPTELYACIYAREFPAQSMLRLRPDLRERAVAVLHGNPPLETVCALNARARRLGVERGMTRVEVDTFESVAVLSRSAVEESATRAALLECAGAFSPRIEECSADGEFLCVVDIAGTGRLFGPPETLARNLLLRLRALGIAACVWVSRNFHAAVCSARGRPAQTGVIPAGVEAIALAPLPIAVLGLSEQHTATFSLWGIRTVGELAALPARELAARLGQHGTRLRQMSRGTLPHLFLPAELPFCLEERMQLDAPVEQVESLLFLAGNMLEQLVLRASARVLALAEVNVELALETGGTHIRRIRPALASNDRAMWLKLIHLDLESHPPTAAVLGIGLSAEPGATSKVQMGLFAPQTPESGRLDVTLARIAAIVGEDAVGRLVLEDTHRADAFRMERFTAPANSPSTPPARSERQRPCTAVRQLRPPERVAMKLHQERPVGFVFRDKPYAVERAYGPWRSSGEWWSPTLWSVEQWDLIARAADGAMLCCTVVRDAPNLWRIAGLYD